jgi:hypothetical protein
VLQRIVWNISFDKLGLFIRSEDIMKSLIIGVALCAAAFPALAQTNVSISVGQPGFYGRIDIGDFAPPPVVYAPQPVIIAPAPHYVAEPVYLRVPPGHRKHWGKYCGRYGACGRPVLFVRDEWYTNTYAPRYREHFGGHHDGRGHGRGHGEGHGEGHGHGHGKGHGNGHGHGRGHD